MELAFRNVASDLEVELEHEHTSLILLPLGLEPRTFRLLAECSNQLSYESTKLKCGATLKAQTCHLQIEIPAGPFRQPPNCDIYGAGGYRSRYLSHAKRALYHLSYGPVTHKGFAAPN